MEQYIFSDEENEEDMVVGAAKNPRANYRISGPTTPSTNRNTGSQLAVPTFSPKPSIDAEQDRDSTVTTTMSVRSDGTTPDEFRLTDVVPKVNKALLSTPTYSCLKPQNQLMTDIVDDMMALLIIVHDMEERVSFADSVVWRKVEESVADSQKSYGLIMAALKVEALNSSVMLVNIWVASPPHFLLAAVLFDEKGILLINSLPDCPQDIQPLIHKLFHLVAACYCAAGLMFDQADWKNYMESHCAVQVGGTDCGLFVIVKTLAIVRRKPFYTSEDIPESEHLRAWVLSCLSHDTVSKPVDLKTWKVPKRLPRSGRDALCRSLANLACLYHPVVFKSMATAIHKSIKGPHFVEGKCGKVSCPAQPAVGGKSIMCAHCRAWYHVGSCVGSTVVQERFYICDLCTVSKVANGIIRL